MKKIGINQNNYINKEILMISILFKISKFDIIIYFFKFIIN